MHAASRTALAEVARSLDEQISGSVVTAATLGAELFDAVEFLDDHRGLRVAVAEASSTPQQRQGLISDVFAGKVSEHTLAVLKEAAGARWSTPREFRTGLVSLGRRSLLRGAEIEGTLEQVEGELFQLSRLLERHPELTQLLSERAAARSRQRGLLATVLYGKVSKYTEALALQVIGRPEHNPIDDIAALATEAARLRGRMVAKVTAAGPLSAEQEQALALKLGRIYGHEMDVFTEVDESLLGGMTIRVGDERIDGSTAGKIRKLRAQLAG
ncbi:F0F1 ATP synthase subunit delta [Corynebacterium mastitidis]|uniref:F0F1 ATP synthase subunit delta n=1 Tax=Corynebacterium mastitidis TaxID=161890 RepID=UPI0003AA244B|nr:F0F1 ATP synthase subunit delta [Corynebacterium mastitidis]